LAKKPSKKLRKAKKLASVKTLNAGFKR